MQPEVVAESTNNGTRRGSASWITDGVADQSRATSLSLVLYGQSRALNDASIDTTSRRNVNFNVSHSLSKLRELTIEVFVNMDRTTITSKPSLSRPSSVTSSNTTSTNKNRQYAHLHAQLAQLNAHLADTESLLKITAVQAQDMRFLGGYVGALFMGSAKVLGEESVQGRGRQPDGAKES